MKVICKSMTDTGKCRWEDESPYLMCTHRRPHEWDSGTCKDNWGICFNSHNNLCSCVPLPFEWLMKEAIKK